MLRTPERVRAEQLRLERHEVPVAGREVDDALEVEVVLDPERDGHRAHPDAGHRRVADVDGVDAGGLEQPRGLDGPLDADRARRVDLDRDDEAAVRGAPGAGRSAGGASGVAARRRRDRRDDRRASRGRRAARSAPARRTGARASSAARIAAMCSGVVPQQPPTIAAPAATNRGVTSARYVRARGVDELALDPLGQAGVGEDRPGGRRPSRSRASRQPCGPAPQLTPMTSTSRAAIARAAAAGVVPSGQLELLAERQQRDDRQVGRGRGPPRPRCARCSTERERLEPEQVDAALEQAVDGLAERRPDRRVVEVEQVAGRRAERPDRPGDQHVAPGDVACLAGELGAATGQLAGLVGQPERGEPHAVGPERGGLDEVGARPRGTRGGSAPISSGRVATSSSRFARCGIPREKGACPSPRRRAAGPRASRSRNRARLHAGTIADRPVRADVAPSPDVPRRRRA